MNRVIFIIPYYGKLPKYFDAWLISAKAQKKIDFLFITDLLIEQNADSENIRILSWSFAKLKNYIQGKFDFTIALKTPYKLCDFKPAYGYIFEDYIKNYEFWGHCDIDTVFGDLFKYLEEPINKYDSIGRWGHLSLYRNTPKINRLFTSDSGMFNYREVYADKHSYCFDETPGIKMMIKKENISHYWDFPEMVDATLYCRALIGIHGFNNYRKQIFFYENGKVYQCYEDNKKIEYRELMYIHFKKKYPTVPRDLKDSFYIFYDQFIPRISSEQDVGMLNKRRYYQSRIVIKIDKFKRNFKMAYNYLFKMDKEQRKINMLKRNISLD